MSNVRFLRWHANTPKPPAMPSGSIPLASSEHDYDPVWAKCQQLKVVPRFPQMKFSFLEGGVGWARSLLADLIGHWEKRNREALANYDPRNIDQELLAELSRRYGGKVIEGREYVKGREIVRIREGDPSDDFANCAITRKEDFRELFLKPFFFGCEADDPVTASAFDAVRNPLSARINALYGSDIGHFDVPDMSEVTAEAYEPVERGSDDRG